MDGGAKQVPQPLELQREHAHASAGGAEHIHHQSGAVAATSPINTCSCAPHLAAA